MCYRYNYKSKNKFKNQNRASQLYLHRKDFLSYSVFHEGVEKLFLLWTVGILNS